VRCASTGAERRGGGLCADPAYVVIPPGKKKRKKEAMPGLKATVDCPPVRTLFIRMVRSVLGQAMLTSSQFYSIRQQASCSSSNSKFFSFQTPWKAAPCHWTRVTSAPASLTRSHRQ
jgi:hypothetical protein